MPTPGAPGHPDGTDKSPQPEPPLEPLLDACAALLHSQRHLTERLRTAGLIDERAVTAVLAREDQIDATITDLRTQAGDR